MYNNNTTAFAASEDFLALMRTARPTFVLDGVCVGFMGVALQ